MPSYNKQPGQVFRARGRPVAATDRNGNRKGGRNPHVLRTFGHIGRNKLNLTGNAVPLPIDRTVEATSQESEL
jgi:hypothetical protein